MEIGLRSAFIISAIIHAAIAAPLYNYNLLKDDFVKKDAVIVDYVILSQISNTSIASLSGKESVAVSDTPQQDIKKSPSENNAVTKHDKAYYKKKTGLKNKPAQNTAQEAHKKDAQISSSKEYISYYESLKEKIKARLRNNYRFYSGEGDIYMSFALNAKGELLSYDIDRSRSSKDEVLLQVARTSLVAVAPFGLMPKSISAPQRSFSITISFKRQ